ncbi:hypothetical protein [Mycobacterium leprae]|nr:hypothetical protein [Mycobacterium leprae]
MLPGSVAASTALPNWCVEEHITPRELVVVSAADAEAASSPGVLI